MITSNLEKIVFLDMTNKVIPTLPNSDYFKTYSSLTEEEKEYHGRLSRQIHRIWTEINTPSISGLREKIANSIEEYDKLVEKVDYVIMNCSQDFGLTLKKQQMDEKAKAAIIKLLGIDFYRTHFEQK